MPKNRKGSQNPTILIKRPYKNSLGDEAAKLDNSTGRKCQRWQALLLHHILAVNKKELWVHTKLIFIADVNAAKCSVIQLQRTIIACEHKLKIHTLTD